MDLSYIKRNWTNTMHNNTSAGIAAWDSVAENFVYDDSVSLSKNEFLKYLQEKIELNNEMSVLDIGCGAGAYSVALSKAVKNVVATDFSPKMLEVGKKYILDNKISNIEFLERNWWDCDGDEFKRKYDLVFAHTTPAIADYDSFIKMIEASKRYCAICKPVRRVDKIADVVNNIAGLEKYDFDESVVYFFDTIWALGYNPEVSYRKKTWESFKPVEESKIWYLNHLKASYELDKDKEKRICKYLEDISENGLVKENTNVTLVTMFWEVV